MIDSSNFLSFLYIGAPRSGSTWLAASLSEHPQIWIPHNKEIHFFNDRMPYPFEYKYPKGTEYYQRFFDKAPRGVKIGELSPLSYFDPNAAYRIHKHFPNVKLIVFLRNPVEVVYSSYLKRYQLEPREKSLELELQKNPYFLDLGFYHRLLTPYFDWFPKEQIYVAIYEEFFANQEHQIKGIYSYIGVDGSFRPSTVGKRINVTAPPKSLVYRYLNGLILKIINRPKLVFIKNTLHKLKINKASYKSTEGDPYSKIKPQLRDNTKMELMKQFSPDILRLEKLLERSLDIWKK